MFLTHWTLSCLQLNFNNQKHFDTELPGTSLGSVVAGVVVDLTGSFANVFYIGGILTIIAAIIFGFVKVGIDKFPIDDGEDIGNERVWTILKIS